MTQRGRRALQKVLTLAELHDISDMLELPGIAPSDWSSWTLGAAEAAGNGRYIHDRVRPMEPCCRSPASDECHELCAIAKGVPATLVLNSSDERPMVAEGKV